MFQENSGSFGKKKVFNVSYVMKLWALTYVTGNDKEHLKLVFFSRIFFLHDSQCLVK